MSRKDRDRATGEIGDGGRPAYALRGYRPDVNTIYSIISKKRTTPVFREHSLTQEARWCALYVAEDEMSLMSIVKLARMGPQRVKDMFAAWGVDWQRRCLIEEPKTVEEQTAPKKTALKRVSKPLAKGRAPIVRAI